MENIDIKFAHGRNKEFVVELRESVSKYFETNNKSEYGNANLVFKTIFMLSLVITPYVLMISGVISSFAGIFSSWVIMGIGVAGVGMGVMHDANHRSYSKNKIINKWMGNTLYLLGGSPLTWQYQHNTLHHGFTNIEGHDEDISPGPVMRFSPHKPLLKFHKYQHLYAWFLYGLMTLTWVTAKDFKQLYRYRKSGATLSNKRSDFQLWFGLAFSKVIYYIAMIVIPIIVLPVAWYWVIIFFLLKHFISGFILTIIFQTAHVVPTSKYPLPDENGTIENNWAVHQLYTTSDFAPKSRIFSWYIGGLNYQVEHHLFPNISHVHYRKISKIVQEIAKKHNLPYHVEPGFFIALWKHGQMLRKLGQVQTI